MADYIHLEVNMSKKARQNHLFLLLMIAFTEYIAFSSSFTVIMGLLAVPVISSVLFVTDSKITRFFYLAFAAVVSFTTFCLSSGNDIISFVSNYFQIHLTAFIIFYCISGNKDFKETMAYLTIVNIIFVVADLTIIRFYHKVDFIGVYSDTFDEYIKSISVIAGAGEFIPGVTSAEITEILNSFKSTIIMLVPSMLIISCMLVSFVTLQLTTFVLRTYLHYDNSNLYFRNFKMKFYIAFVNIVLLIVSLISEKEFIIGVTYNFVLISMFLFSASGLSVICNLLYKKIKSRFALFVIFTFIVVALIFSALILGTAGGISILFYIGMLDSSFNFRKLKKK